MKHYNYTVIRAAKNIDIKSGPCTGDNKADVINYWANLEYSMLSLIELTEDEHKKIDENNRRIKNE